MKLFRLDLPPDRVHRLVAELQALVDADLTHPAIAAPIAAGISGVEAYLAQDFVAAESADAVVRAHGPAPPADALRVAMQLAGAFDFAADAQIVHGAFHLRDALVSPDDVRVTGLGIVRALERAGVDTPIRRPYTAPERASGGSWNRRADIFSLAALIHELLWGRRVAAFGEEAAAALTEIAGVDVSQLRPVFARALAEDPADRFESATEFAAALRNAFVLAAPPIRELTVVPDADIDVDDEVSVVLESKEPAVEAEPPRAVASPIPKLPELEFDAPELEEPDLAVRDSSPEFLAGVGEQLGPALDTDLPLHDDFDVAKVFAAEPAPSVAEPDRPIPDFEAVEPPALALEPIDEVLEPTTRRLTPPPIPVPPSLEFAEAASFERSRSAIWPLSLALVIGVAVGFALGYGVGNRPQPPIVADRESPSPAVAATSGTTSRGVAETEVRLPDTPAAARAFPTSSPAVAGVGAELPPSPNGFGGQVARPASAATGGASSAPTNAANVAKTPAVRPASAPLPVATGPGRILVRTTPAGAIAYLDGKEVGRTPVTVRDVTRGTHTLRVVRDGFSPAERRIPITSAQPAQSVTVTLARARSSSVPAAGTGQVSAESRPAGASIFLDGKLVGKTPMVLMNVGEGEHSMAMDLEGFRRWSSSVRVVSGERARITASLEK